MNEKRTPRLPLTDRKFRYAPSYATDIRRTFARVRREQRKQQAAA